MSSPRHAAPPPAGDPWARHTTLLAAGLVLVGFALRLLEAHGTLLNGDEALHFHLFRQSSAAEVYRQSLTNAHPPLYFLGLYVWSLLGDSELHLRLPAVVCGSLFLWQSWRWAELALGRAVGLTTLALLTFSPELVSLCAQVRGYGVFLFCAASAWLWLERALAQRSVRALVWFAVFLDLAILVHYSALWVTVAAGIYALARLRGMPRPWIRSWIVTQLVAAGLYAGLAVSHLTTLRGSPLEQEVLTTWLRNAYFQPGEVAALAWVPRQAEAFFRWLLWWPRNLSGVAMLEQLHLPSRVLGVLALLGIVALGLRRKPVAWLLGAPWALAIAAGLLRLYPLGATRHSAWLALPAAAAASAGLSWLARGRAWPMVLLALLAPTAWALREFLPSSPHPIVREAMATGHMQDALAALQRMAPPGEWLFTDQQTLMTLEYYLARDQVAPTRFAQDGLIEGTLGRRFAIAVPAWQTTGPTFLAHFRRVIEARKLESGTPLWVLAMGAENNLAVDLIRARAEPPGLQMFGRGIGLFRALVP